jgi:hypothetical protein
VNSSQVPTNGYFNMLMDDGAKHGLMYYTAGNTGFATMKIFLPQMPPSPAPPLTDREFNIIWNWAQNPLP